MLCTLLLAAAPLPAAATAPVMRSVTVSVYTKKAEPVSDLKPEEVVVTDGSRKTPVLGLEPDERPLAVAVVIDSSAAVAPVYRSDLVAAVTSFWRALPQGSEVGVFTSGPPSRVVDFGVDLATAEPRLQRVAPAGKNYAFEAMRDAARGLGPPGSRRHVLVYVGSGDIEAGTSRSAEAMQALGQSGATPMVVLILPGGASAALGGPTSGVSLSWDVQGYFERMAQVYRGSCAVILSSQAAMKALRDAAADLSAQYRVRYESTADRGTEPPKVEVRRKGVKSRVGRTQIEVLKVD
jgi:hypothetical protein